MNAQFRKYWYLFTGLIAAVIPIAIQFGLFSETQGNNTTTLLTTLGSMLGAGGALTAGAVVHKQQQEGIAEAADASDPLAIIESTIQQAADAQANVDKMRSDAGNLLNSLSQTLNVTPIAMIPGMTDVNNTAIQALNKILIP